MLRTMYYPHQRGQRKHKATESLVPKMTYPNLRKSKHTYRAERSYIKLQLKDAKSNAELAHVAKKWEKHEHLHAKNGNYIPNPLRITV